MARHLVLNGKKARQLRERRVELTQDEAAAALKVASSTIRRIESGERSVQLTTLGKLAELYGVKPEALLKWRE